MSVRFPCHTAVWSAVCLLILFLAGCSPLPSRDLLWYQDTMTAASLTESDSGRSWRITFTDGGFTAALTAPPCVAGIVFTVSEAEAYAESGPVRIPVGEAVLAGACRAVSCLTLTADALTGIEPAPEGGVTAHFTRGEAQYDVLLGEDGLPLWIEVRENGARFRYDVSVETAP